MARATAARSAASSPSVELTKTRRRRSGVRMAALPAFSAFTRPPGGSSSTSARASPGRTSIPPRSIRAPVGVRDDTPAAPSKHVNPAPPPKQQVLIAPPARAPHAGRLLGGKGLSDGEGADPPRREDRGEEAAGPRGDPGPRQDDARRRDPITAPLVSAVPIVVDPQALRRRIEALSIIEAAVRVPEAGINEGQYRAHRIRPPGRWQDSGFRKGGLPRSLFEAAGPSKPIRLRWGDGRLDGRDVDMHTDAMPAMYLAWF